MTEDLPPLFYEALNRELHHAADTTTRIARRLRNLLASSEVISDDARSVVEVAARDLASLVSQLQEVQPT
jgi:hypothetical protein